MTDDLQDLKRRLVVGRKADGRCVYDEQAKAELVALCTQPGASVSRLALECGVNANQVSHPQFVALLTLDASRCARGFYRFGRAELCEC